MDACALANTLEEANAELLLGFAYGLTIYSHKTNKSLLHYFLKRLSLRFIVYGLSFKAW